jgi:DHA2 family multidrug resistance protein
MVARHEQTHRADLVRHVTLGNPAFQQAFSSLETLLRQNSGPFAPVTDVLSRAYAMLEGTVTQQARLLAYVDDFRYMALVCFLCVPLVMALKKARRSSGQISAGH